MAIISDKTRHKNNAKLHLCEAKRLLDVSESIFKNGSKSRYGTKSTRYGMRVVLEALICLEAAAHTYDLGEQ